MVQVEHTAYMNTFSHLVQIVDSTLLVSYDVRFESPEYGVRSQHSRNSDVWR